MIQITPSLSIDENDIQVDYIQASGPGGQNVNKVATQAQLRFNTALLPEAVRLRLEKLAPSRITSEGVLVIQARRYRTQEQNRQDGIERLTALLSKAAQPPKPRHKTRPSLAAKQARLDQKRRRSENKRLRRQIPDDN